MLYTTVSTPLGFTISKSKHVLRHSHAHAEYRFGVKEAQQLPIDQYPDAKFLYVEVIERFFRTDLRNSNALCYGS